MKVAPEVLAVLDTAAVFGKCVRLAGQLDRKLYVATDKVLKAAGGKWNRGVGAHVFDRDAEDAIEQIVLTGEVTTPQEFGQFDSPPAVVERVMALANVQPGEAVLEPSAGLGNIVSAVLEREPGALWAVEIDPRRAETLRRALVTRQRSPKFTAMLAGDFLAQPVEAIGPVDVVVMNPPFARQADLAHVRHAARFLRPGGRLVAVMSAAVRFRENAATGTFRRWVDDCRGVFHDLPPGSFKAAGTAVNACLLTLTIGSQP